MRILIACALALVLTACAINPNDYPTPEAYQQAVEAKKERLEGYRQYAQLGRLVAVSALENLNQSGIDPFQMDAGKLLKYSALCSTAVAIVTVIDPEMATLSSDGTQFCSLITQALAKAPEDPP